jgi:hypothetical protein
MILILILAAMCFGQAPEDPAPRPDRLQAPDDSAAKTDEEFDAAWVAFRRPTDPVALRARLDKWARHCDRNGGLKFAEPQMFVGVQGADIAAWSHPQTFGRRHVVLVRGTNLIEAASDLCLPVFMDGRKDRRTLRAFFWLDRQSEAVRLVTKEGLAELIAEGSLTPVE